MLKQGAVVHGYRIVSRPTNADAGKCLWAFAEKGDKQFFIKEFLDPKRPRKDSMGSPEHKRLMFARCEEFERRHWSVIQRIKPNDIHAGNLVMAVDFFFEGARYYKVTERLYPTRAQPHELSSRRRTILLGTLADSLQLLHRLEIVHGDLKPQNVLLHQPEQSDLFVAKLIDFDDAYVSCSPPAREVIGGDVLYGAPEWVRYMRGDPNTGPGRLTPAVDMFAFGLIIHTYLTGALPGYSARFETPAEAVNAGESLTFDNRLSPACTQLLSRLAAADPMRRPRIADVEPLLNETDLAIAAAAPEKPASRLRINMTGRPARATEHQGRQR